MRKSDGKSVLDTPISFDLKPFLDGCHRFGWVIVIISQLIFYSYVSGQWTQHLHDLEAEMRQRITRIETQIDNLIHVR